MPAYSCKVPHICTYNYASAREAEAWYENDFLKVSAFCNNDIHRQGDRFWKVVVIEKKQIIIILLKAYLLNFLLDF